MKRNMAHSPLPWKRGTDGLIYDCNDEFVVDTCGTSLPPHGEENQKFIVHVANTHQQLLDACENALGAYEALEISGVASQLPGHASCLKDLKAAIAKATD